MSTEFSFEKASMSTNEHGVFLHIKLPFESRQAARDFVNSIKEGVKYLCTLKEKKMKRTLDQNGLYWALCGELSAVTRIPPREIYREHVKDVGGNYEITPIRADGVKRWMEIWESKGIGFIAEDMGDSKIEGYRNIRNYYGSSTYDTKQMSRLLDLIIADCDENGIMTPDREELLRLEENVKE